MSDPTGGAYDLYNRYADARPIDFKVDETVETVWRIEQLIKECKDILLESRDILLELDNLKTSSK